MRVYFNRNPVGAQVDRVCLFLNHFMLLPSTGDLYKLQGSEKLKIRVFTTISTLESDKLQRTT